MPDWSENQLAELIELAKRGLTARQIGDQLGRGRNAIIGKMHREGIPLFGARGLIVRGPEAVKRSSSIATRAIVDEVTSQALIDRRKHKNALRRARRAKRRADALAGIVTPIVKKPPMDPAVRRERRRLKDALRREAEREARPPKPPAPERKVSLAIAAPAKPKPKPTSSKQASVKAPMPIMENVIVPQPSNVFTFKGVTIMGLTALTCRWPIGDPYSADFCYCGNHVHQAGKPYCPYHSALAFEAPHPRRRA